jgi:hypothetical protein
MDGYGLYRWHGGGHTYEGQWMDGDRHGIGIYTVDTPELSQQM